VSVIVSCRAIIWSFLESWLSFSLNYASVSPRIGAVDRQPHFQSVVFPERLS
jgi:hypothetical protein